MSGQPDNGLDLRGEVVVGDGSAAWVADARKPLRRSERKGIRVSFSRLKSRG